MLVLGSVTAESVRDLVEVPTVQCLSSADQVINELIPELWVFAY